MAEEKPKKRINAKQKGNSFERKVAKALTDWSGQKFIRTPMSGAIHNFHDKRVVSDIVAPVDMKWPFSVECKSVMYDWEFSTIIEGTSTFWKHWEQANEDSEREGVIPMLVFTKNYRDTFMAIYGSTFESLQQVTGKTFLCSHIMVESPRNTTDYKSIVILKFSDFLSTYRLRDIEKFSDYVLKSK